MVFACVYLIAYRSLEHEKNRAERKRKDKQKGVANSIQQIKHTHDRAENLDREQTKHEDKLTKVREEEVNRKLRIDEFKGKVDRFKHQLANPPDTSDWDAVQAELVRFIQRRMKRTSLLTCIPERAAG
jgi:chromosome segregation ATPase